LATRQKISIRSDSSVGPSTLADPAAIGALTQQQDGKLQTARTAAPSPAPVMTAPLSTSAPATPTPSPSATAAPAMSPSPTATPKPLALSTSKALQQVALQQVDFPSFERDGYVKFDAAPSSRVLALYGDIWEQDTPRAVTFVIERLKTYGTPLHAQVGSFAPYEDVVSDATIVGASRLPSLGIGDIDYALSYQLVDERSGEKFLAFEESAVVGSSVVDITVVNSSNFLTVNDAALYARIVAGRVANAQH
jgi:hypothetical protein